MGTVTTFRIGWKQISRKAQWVLCLYTVSLVLVSGLDGLGLYLFSKMNLNVASELNQPTQSGNLILGVWCIALFFLRSAIASGITWFGYTTLAHEETQIGQTNLRTYLNMSWESRISEKVSGIYEFVDRGPNSLVQQYLLSFATLFAEVFSSLVIFGVILQLNPITAISGFLFFILVAYFQHRIISLSSRRAGLEIAEHFTDTYNDLSDAFHLAKLLQVTRSKSFESMILIKRRRLSRARSRAIFIESLPRYLMESVLVLGVVFVGFMTLITQGNKAIVPSLAVFAVAAFRILPSINRVQGLILGLIGREPIAKMAQRNIDEIQLKTFSRPESKSDDMMLEITNLFFSYKPSVQPLLSDISLEFHRGRQYAIAGPSGAGKSTLMDVCMGLLNPDSGNVSRYFAETDSIAYLPQETFVVSASLAQNVALEWSNTAIDFEKVHRALELSKLDIQDLTYQVSQHNLSGGQKQRLGLARALYRDPTFLCLDEPTSALDVDTETDVMETINGLRGKTTVLIATHKASTIQHADIVIYIDKGKVLGYGPLAQVRSMLPDFDGQI